LTAYQLAHWPQRRTSPLDSDHHASSDGYKSALCFVHLHVQDNLRNNSLNRIRQSPSRINSSCTNRSSALNRPPYNLIYPPTQTNMLPHRSNISNPSLQRSNSRHPRPRSCPFRNQTHDMRTRLDPTNPLHLPYRNSLENMYPRTSHKRTMVDYLQWKLTSSHKCLLDRTKRNRERSPSEE
jgi:hypothetical protein